MKRFSVLASVVGVCGAFAASGTSSIAASSPGDSVVGNGKLPATPSGCVNELTVVAHSGVNGGNPRGSLSYDDNECNRFFIGDVACLRVDGNPASIVAEFRQNEADPRFAGLVVLYEDNGPPSGGTPADFQENRRLSSNQLEDRLDRGCPEPTRPATQLTQGNIKVRDRHAPMPTRSND